MEQEKPHFAVIAGLCASFASLFGKLTANSARLLGWAGLSTGFRVELAMCETFLDDDQDEVGKGQVELGIRQRFWTKWPVGEVLVQALCVLIMILLNGCVWRFFVKALHTGSGSTLRASLASAATNYVASAVLGMLLFNEHSTLLWWLGTMLVLAGLLLIIGGSDEATESLQSNQTQRKMD